MPVQYTPQQLLDQLNQTGFEDVYSTDMTTKERAARIKVVKQKLKLVKQGLRSEQDDIKRRWDGRIASEAERERIELAPYSLVQQSIEQLETALLELETAIKFNSSIPLTPEIPVIIVGGEKYGSYLATSNREAADQWIQEEEAKIKAAADEVRRIQLEHELALAENKRRREEAEAAWQQAEKERQQEARKQKFRSDMREAASLMQAKRYKDALNLYRRYRHPKSQEYAQQASKLLKIQNRNKQYISYAILLGGLITIIAVIYWRRNQPSELLLYGSMALLIFLLVWSNYSQRVATQKRIEQIMAKKADWGEAYCDAIIRGKIAANMTADMVIAAWGRPNNIDQNEITSTGIRKIRWVYGRPRKGANYVYFKNDRVDKIKT